MSHKQLIVRMAVAVAAITFVAALGAYGATYVRADRSVSPSAAPAAAASARAAAQVAARAAVSADGYLVPLRYAALSLGTGGRIAAIKVAEGQTVAAGDILIALDDSVARQALAGAEAGQAEAEANVARVKAAARSQEVAQSQATLNGAQARLDRLLKGATAEQIATAQQAVAVAQANLARVQAGPTPDQLAAAQSVLANAEAAVKSAQAAYDRVKGDPNIGARPEALKLEQATNDFRKAEADYRDLVDGATPGEVNVARQQVAQAQAALNEVAAGTDPADIAAAQAEVDKARAGLELLLAGPRSEDVALAQAQVAQARAGVAQAEAALDQTRLRAPFAGIVGAIDLAPGEYASPGIPAVRLGDTSGWLVETDNLTEQEVVGLAPGDALTVIVDAFPQARLSGTLQSIRPAGALKRGDVTYKVTVSLPATDLALRWGMTAGVSR